LFRWNQLIREIKPDIIVGSTPKAALLSMLTGSWNSIPARVYHARGFRAEGLSGINRKIAIAAERRTARAATKVLCDSESLRKALVAARCISVREGVVLGSGSCCGVDTNYFRPPTPKEKLLARHRLGIHANDFILGYVGRITRDKGVGELIDAVTLVNQIHNRVRLILFGSDEGVEELLDGLKPNTPVTYMGITSDTRSAYWAFDAFALPSYREGFPIAPLEAQACGLATITTTATGCIDSQPPGNSQLTVPTRSSEAIAEAIDLLVTASANRAVMSLRAREWVVSHFDSTVVVEKQVGFLKEQVTT